jgi:hypothetical protein
MDGVMSYFESTQPGTVITDTRDISGEEKLIAEMIRRAWREYYSESKNERRAAISFIKNGLRLWTDLANLDYQNVVNLIKRNKYDDLRSGHSHLIIEWQGEKNSLAVWAEKLGIGKNTFRARLNDWGYCEKTFTKRV